MGDIGFNDYITIYKKDYKKKETPVLKKCEFISDYKDILSGPFTEYILPSFKTTEEHEDPKICFNRLHETYPKMQRYLNTAVDEERISFPYKNSGKTVYQVELCRYEDGFESKKTLSRKRANLPPNWDETPLTTQRCSYRDFRKLFAWNVTPKPCKPPPESLKPNYKEREILKVTTGDSEYNDRIGKLGIHVIENKLHGVIQDAEYCKIWEKIQLKNAGKPYKVIPPYPTQT